MVSPIMPTRTPRMPDVDAAMHAVEEAAAALARATHPDVWNSMQLRDRLRSAKEWIAHAESVLDLKRDHK